MADRHPHWTNLVWAILTGLAFIAGALFRQIIDGQCCHLW